MKLTIAAIAVSLASLVSMLAPVEASSTDTEATPLEYQRLDLTDGRRLRDVVIRSYDPAADRFLLVAQRKAMTIPARLIPEAIAAKLKQAAPQSGSSVSSTPKSPSSPPSTHTAREPAPAPSRQQAARPSDSAREDQSARANAEAHRTAAIEHARTFYRYEFKAGSDAIRVQSVHIEAGAAKPITGWENRYRTQGTAHLEIFDTKGWSATRAKSTFEIVTEEKSNEPIAIIDFARKT